MKTKKLDIDTSNASEEYWDRILEQENLSMTRGSVRDDVQQKWAVVNYLENMNTSPAREEDVKDGFQIEEELGAFDSRETAVKSLIEYSEE